MDSNAPVHLPYAEGCQPDTVAAISFNIGRTIYRVEIQPWPDGTFVWNAYRGIPDKYGTGSTHFERIPARSRSECARFPKTVGMKASAFLEQYRQQKAAQA